MTRAKFRVDEIKATDENIYDTKLSRSVPKQVLTITLSAVYAGSPENTEFFASTPSGQITLAIVNPSAAEIFKAGKEVYVDFIPVE